MKAQLEKVITPPHGSFSLFRYQNSHFDAPWHFHPEYELTYIVESNGIRYVGDSVMEFTEGDLVLLGPNLPHCWKNTAGHALGSESIVVQWHTDFLGQGWLQKSEFVEIRKMLARSSRGLRFDDRTATEIAPQLSHMLEKGPFERLISLLGVLKNLATKKNVQILSGDNFKVILNQGANHRIDKIQNYVSDHFDKGITLGEMASLVAMSEEGFCRFFKRTFNKPFFVFLNEYKVKLACKMLLESRLQVSEIAYSCGYESLPFFYRQFKKFMGCSPMTYRKKFLEGTQVNL